MSISILIPALNPDGKLLTLIGDLHNLNLKNIVVVNDGSSPSSLHIFEKAKNRGCTVLNHAANLGKGRALKTGLNYIYTNEKFSKTVVTADCDGQHKADDINKIARSSLQNSRHLIIGTRKFKGKIPFRSLVGNVLTKNIFRFLLGKKISDTQSGLRAMPVNIIPKLLKLHGERFEYETNILISCGKLGWQIKEIPIETVYIEDNKSSHFNPFLDSMLIYFLFLRFSFSSLFASFIDFIVFLITYKTTNNILTGIITARIVASLTNFFINKRLVFHSKERILTTIVKYYALTFLLGTVAYASIDFLHTAFSVNVIPAKILTEVTLFLASFAIQRDFIFSGKKTD